MPHIKKHEVFHCFRELSRKGVLGNYNGCEIYTIFYQRKMEAQKIYNLYTLVNFGVFSANDFIKEPDYLSDRIRIKTDHDQYVVGIIRYCRSLEFFTSFYVHFLKNGIWNCEGNTLTHNATYVIPGVYVPGEATMPPVFNKILKNNFFSGSYLIEHFDCDKSYTKFLRQNHELLAKLSTQIGNIIPLQISSVSDRLGNIVLQFPQMLVRCDFNRGDDFQTLIPDIKIAPGTTCSGKYKLIAMSECDDGKYLCDFNMADITLPGGALKLNHSSGAQGYYLVDAVSGLIMSSFKGNYIKQICGEIKLHAPEPRIVNTSNGNQRIKLQTVQDIKIQSAAAQDLDYWETERIFDAEQNELEQTRSLKQYGKLSGHNRLEALSDIRYLISRHGRYGVWLWDPFLSAQDVVDTLFTCPFRNADLRALGSSKVVKITDAGHDFEIWRDNSTKFLTSLPAQAKIGLHLEFRVQHGNFGDKFHDRFLLFPRNESRPKVWALGTSVNSLGNEHHIINEIQHPANLILAFQKHWDALTDKSCLVWKS